MQGMNNAKKMVFYTGIYCCNKEANLILFYTANKNILCGHYITYHL